MQKVCSAAESSRWSMSRVGQDRSTSVCTLLLCMYVQYIYIYSLPSTGDWLLVRGKSDIPTYICMWKREDALGRVLGVE